MLCLLAEFLDSTQLAFILNYQHHWFTLRRFGPAVANIEADIGEGHWFNLNSFLDSPEWVGKLYLGMVLQQAEKAGTFFPFYTLPYSQHATGYSVFAVTQTDPTAHLALARTEADHVASTLPEPASATPVTPFSTSDAHDQSKPVEGFEDEDMELQAALQASLMGGSTGQHVPPPTQLPLTLLPSYGRHPIPSGSNSRASGDSYVETTDPIAASLARNKVIMDRMRNEQEMAQRELYEEEVARLGRPGNPVQPSLRNRTEQEDEDEMLMRAIAESRASARVEGHGKVEEEEEEDLDDMDLDTDYQPVGRVHQQGPLLQSNSYPDIATHGERVYDDDDAELQAALRASLENVPEGFTVPVHAKDVSTNEEADPEPEQGDTVSEADTSMISSEHPGPSVVPSVDEIRKMRLARFGV